MCCDNCDDPNAVDFHCRDQGCECHACPDCGYASPYGYQGKYCGGDKCVESEDFLDQEAV